MEAWDGTKLRILHQGRGWSIEGNEGHDHAGRIGMQNRGWLVVRRLDREEPLTQSIPIVFGVFTMGWIGVTLAKDRAHLTLRLYWLIAMAGFGCVIVESGASIRDAWVFRGYLSRFVSFCPCLAGPIESSTRACTLLDPE